MIQFQCQGNEWKICNNADDFPQNNKLIASISDGQTWFSDNIPVMRSFWIRWKEYLKITGLKMAGLRLQIDQTTVQFPTRDGKYTIKPIAYYYMNRFEGDMYGPKSDFTCIGYVVENSDIIRVVMFKKPDLKYIYFKEIGFNPNDLGIIMCQ